MARQRSIYSLMQQVRNHPDFVGGTIFTIHDIPEGKRLPPNWREKWLTDSLTEHGNAVLDDLLASSTAFNPKRRKNIGSSAAGSYDYGSSRSQRSYKRDRNPYSKRYTLASFSKKYWGEWYEEVDRTTRMQFWDDFKYAFIGGLGRYKEETRG